MTDCISMSRMLPAGSLLFVLLVPEAVAQQEAREATVFAPGTDIMVVVSG